MKQNIIKNTSEYNNLLKKYEELQNEHQKYANLEFDLENTKLELNCATDNLKELDNYKYDIKC